MFNSYELIWEKGDRLIEVTVNRGDHMGTFDCISLKKGVLKKKS